MAASGPAQAQVQSKSFRVLLNTLLSRNVPEITVTAAAAKVEAYLFLDAREAAEYKVSHLHNARFVGYDKFNVAALNDLQKNKPIIVYCAIGKRSENITQKLIKAGFTNVHNMYGGIFEWVNRGHAVYDASGKPTAKVHIYNRFFGQWLDKGEKVH